MLPSPKIVALLIVAIVFIAHFAPAVGIRFRRRRRRKPPPPCPYVCSAKNPPVNGNPHRLTKGGEGVCTYTEHRNEQYCTPCHCGSCPAYRSVPIQVLRCCRGRQQSGSTCPIKIPCNSPPVVSYGQYSPSKGSYAVGERAVYSCRTHYELHGSSTVTCQIGPSWTSPPRCLPIPCNPPTLPTHAAISGGARSRYDVGNSIPIVCKSGYRHVSGSSTASCHLGKVWTGLDIVCKPVCFGHVDVCVNGGRCTSPDFCSNCNIGFYSPRCDACSPIANCQQSKCSHPDPTGSLRCHKCALDFGPELGKAYELSADQRTCQKRCSWRADSKQCYPGTCGLVHTCSCASGFSTPATQCNTITRTPHINPGFLRFYYGGGLEGQDSLVNITQSGSRVFTNAEIVKKVSVSISANYIINLPQAPPYIISSSVGLSRFTLDFKLHHSSGTKSLLSISPSMTASGKLKKVHEVSEEVTVEGSCGGKACQLKGNDKFRFVTITENGGFIVIRNPENNKTTRRDFIGRSSERTIEVVVDRDKPQHCSKSSASCGSPLQLSESVTNKTTINASWTGWADSTAGIGRIHLSVSELIIGADGLLTVGHGGSHIYHWSTELSPPTASHAISLPSDRTRVYQVKNTVCDAVIERLKNCQNTRNFVLRDAGSRITTTTSPLTVSGTVSNDGHFWITTEDTALQVGWNGHFENSVHHRGGLLNAIRAWPVNGEDPFYDRRQGIRNISAISNVLGITAFRVQSQRARLGDSRLASPDPNRWQNRGLFTGQNFPYATLKYKDGDSVRFWVEARDIVGHVSIDSITLHTDASPASISNISLVKDGRTGINVHSSRELFKAKFRFNARDEHSGIYNISWMLYDNYTRTDLVHGNSVIGRQKYPNMAACQAAHPASSCYATSMAGIFSDQFDVELTKDGNLRSGLDLSQHDHDLQFKVTVVNGAKLQTQSILQITIDTSGPHPGHVFIGLPGSAHIDFQSSTTIRGYWSDFFDKESSIKFYKYRFASACSTTQNFSLTTATDETSAKHAAWTAPGPGRYFLTVVAYNFALQPSVPVCSNPVVVDSELPVLANISVAGLRTRESLLIDTSNRLWLVDTLRRARLVVNATEACRRVATRLSPSDAVQMPQPALVRRGEKPVHLTDAKCSNIGAFSNVSVLPSEHSINVSFAATDAESGIEDVSVALATSAEAWETPNVLGWTSAHGHSSVLLHHANLRHGSRFFVLLRATNRALLTSRGVFGPIVVNVRPPATSGSVQVERRSEKVYLRWPATAMADNVSPFPLQYKISAGRSLGSSDLFSRRPLAFDAVCGPSETPVCSMVNVSDLQIASGKNIYFTIHVGNTAGHWNSLSSPPLLWVAFSGNSGRVHIIEPTETLLHPTLSRPIRVQSNSTAMRIAWFGFRVPEAVTEAVLVVSEKDAGLPVKRKIVNLKSRLELLSDLRLDFNKTYTASLTVSTTFGNISANSNSVQIIKENQSYTDASVQIGDTPCKSATDCPSPSLQPSTSHMIVRWRYPNAMSDFHMRAVVFLDSLTDSEIRKLVVQRTVAAPQSNITFTGLSLYSGRAYQARLRVCIDAVCSADHLSSVLWVSADSPRPGGTTFVLDGSKLRFTFAKFTLRGFSVSQHSLYMSGYSWRLSGEPHDMRWLPVNISTSNATHISSVAELPANLTRSRCLDFVIRGTTASGVSSEVQRRVRSCSANVVRPNVVIDVSGSLSLDDNFHWAKPDIDYLREGEVLSAVWPSVRHGRVQWCLLESPWNFKGGFFVTERTKLTNPADHRSTVLCGIAQKRFVSLTSLNFTLRVDRRYHICIHANRTVRGRGMSREVFEAVSACGDGVTILSKTPRPGSVNAGRSYQSSANLLRLSWTNYFTGTILDSLDHQSPVKAYYYKIGTSPNDDNIVRYTEVGLKNAITVTGLVLQNGQKYFATVKAINLVNVEAVASAPAILIDLQPPQVSDKTRLRVGDALNEFLTDLKLVRVSWTGLFTDAESGLCSYQWCVGTSQSLCDIVPPRGASRTIVAENLENYLKEGASYFFTIRAFDCVGHSVEVSSSAFRVVKRGPETGVVMDGVGGVDSDYQRYSHRLSAHWSGFFDRYTDVVNYRVHVGSVRGAQDVVSGVSVGLHTNVSFDHLELRFGIKYVFGVTACNRAGLCTTAYSDGLIIDATSPTQGRVRIESNDKETGFQSSRSHVSFALAGFADLESKLATLEWCLSTGSECDITPATRVPFQPNIRAVLGAPLPLNRQLFVRVIVSNHVGLNTSAVSNGILVDNSPPTFSRRPTFGLTRHAIVSGAQVARTVLTLVWDVTDAESDIESQRVSISSHTSSLKVAPPIEIRGRGSGNVTLTELQLQDGYRYRGWVTACNRAGLCTTSSTAEQLLVDNSPPQVGSFLPRTNSSHQSDLEKLMRWSGRDLKLTWHGFSDAHSDMSGYLLSVSSSLLGADLLELTSLAHDATAVRQKGQVRLKRNLVVGEQIFINLRGVNGAGLKSHLLLSAFVAAADGHLDIVRRCSASTCAGHCVCAPLHQACRPSATCNAITGRIGSRSPLAVKDVTNIMDYKSGRQVVDANFTTDRCSYAAAWSGGGIRHEVSAGLANFNTPKGLFDPVTERIWFDVGQDTWAVLNFSMSADKCMRKDTRYKFFVRTWYDSNTYAVFMSDGLIPVVEAPQIMRLRGTALWEADPRRPTHDLDFVGRDTTTLRVHWPRQFRPRFPASLAHFAIALGTYCGGGDVTPWKTLAATTTEHQFTGLRLQHGRRYKTSLRACDVNGLCAEVCSDGVRADFTAPLPGLVLNSLTGLWNARYQSNTTHFAASWQQFADPETYISNYEWCLGTSANASDCSIISWRSVGLQTHVRIVRPDSTPFHHAQRLFAHVRARNSVPNASPALAAGLEVIVDRKPPYLVGDCHGDGGKVKNGAFTQFSGQPAELSSLNRSWWQNTTSQLTDWTLSNSAKVQVVRTAFSHSPDTFVLVRGGIRQTLKTEAGQVYALGFMVADVVNEGDHATKRGFVSIGNAVRHSFEVQARPKTQIHLKWYRKFYHFKATSISTVVELGSLASDVEGLGFDSVRASSCLSSSSSSSQPILLSMEQAKDRVRIHASWSPNDDLSGMAESLWALGTVRGGVQLQPYTRVDAINSVVQTPLLAVTHGTPLHFSLLIVDRAGLASLHHSTPVVVDFSPPSVELMITGSHCRDNCVVRGGSFIVSLEALDGESGVSSCSYALGSRPQASDLTEFKSTRPTFGQMNIQKEIVFTTPAVNGKLVYPIAICVNRRGLSTTKAFTRGVRLVTQPPSATNAYVHLVTPSKTHYPRTNPYQANTDSMVFTWGKFVDGSGASFSYQYSLTGPAGSPYRGDWTFLADARGRMVLLEGLSLSHGVTYQLKVRAINAVSLISSPVATEVKIDSRKPTVTSSSLSITSRSATKIVIDWGSCFTSASPRSYEVSVGSGRGKCDIFGLVETQKTTMTLEGVDPLRSYHLVITAISSSGLYIQRLHQIRAGREIVS